MATGSLDLLPSTHTTGGSLSEPSFSRQEPFSIFKGFAKSSFIVGVISLAKPAFLRHGTRASGKFSNAIDQHGQCSFMPWEAGILNSIEDLPTFVPEYLFV